LLVVLPKIWADARGLKPHDTVELVLNEDLTIKVPKTRTEDSDAAAN